MRIGKELFRLRMIALQDTVVPAVIVSFEFDELVAPCGRARKAQCDLHNFGAAVGEANTICAGDYSRQHLGDFSFEFVLRPKGQAAGNCRLDRLDNFGWCIAKYVRTPSQCVIQIGVAIDVDKL